MGSLVGGQMQDPWSTTWVGRTGKPLLEGNQSKFTGLCHQTQLLDEYTVSQRMFFNELILSDSAA